MPSLLITYGISRTWPHDLCAFCGDCVAGNILQHSLRVGMHTYQFHADSKQCSRCRKRHSIMRDVNTVRALACYIEILQGRESFELLYSVMTAFSISPEVTGRLLEKSTGTIQRWLRQKFIPQKARINWKPLQQELEDWFIWLLRGRESFS